MNVRCVTCGETFEGGLVALQMLPEQMPAPHAPDSNQTTLFRSVATL